MIKAEETQKNRKRNLGRLSKCFLVTVAIGIGIIVAIYTFITRETIIDNVLIRNISYNLEIPKEPIDRKIAWESELPEFIEKDIRQLEEKSDIDIIYYRIGKRIILIEEGKGLKIKLTEEKRVCLSDFSIYRNSSGNLVIYGVNYGSFERYELSSKTNEWKEDTITKNAELPFDIEADFISSVKDFYLYIDRNTDEIFIYRNKQLVSPKYSVGKLQDSYRDGIFVTEDNQVWIAYILPKGEKAEIKLEKIGDVDGIRSYYRDDFCCILENDEIITYLPIFVKNGKYVVTVPANWESYQFYAMHDIEKRPKEPNFQLQLIPLEDIFQSAIIKYNKDRYGWFAEMKLELNGKMAIYDYEISVPTLRMSDNKEIDIPKEIAVTDKISLLKEIKKIREAYLELIKKSYENEYPW